MMKQNLFIVDDTPANIEILMSILGDDFEVAVALDGTSALEDIKAEPPDLILLDIMMPDMDGYEVCQRLKSDPETASIPVIFITAKLELEDELRGFEVGAVDYISKPISPPVVRARVDTHLQLKHKTEQIAQQNVILEQKVRTRTAELQAKNQELRETQMEIIRRLGRAAEFKDNETGMHVVRMSYFAQMLASAAGLDSDHANLIFQAAPMHDIGKIGIPDQILTKPGKLDLQEFEHMKLHPEIGSDIIGHHQSPLLDLARLVALSHHERWDGKGYPHQVAGKDIPIEGRIVAIADVFDALTSVRPYKRAWSVDEAMDLLQKEAGHQFDPVLVPLFINLRPQILEIQRRCGEESAG